MVQKPKTYLTREYVAYVLAYILLKIELGAEDRVLDILKEFDDLHSYKTELIKVEKSHVPFTNNSTYLFLYRIL